MKKIDFNFKNSIWFWLSLLWVILIIALIPTYSHHGNLLIDNGREVYYPTQILSGNVLYKDIFNIYGPFAYLFNALLFKIFSINLNVLYMAGFASTFVIISLIYLIAKRFLSHFVSFSIALFTIAIGVLNLNLFNFIFPYSYAMLYGLVAFLASFIFLLKYQENPKKSSNLYLSSLFAGICVTSKYEFFPYLLVILYVIFKIKPFDIKTNWKEYYYSIFSLIFMPAMCFGILFLQGLGLNDLVSTASIVKNMAQSQTLKYFYLHSGTFFHKQTLELLLTEFIKTTIPLLILLFAPKLKRKILSVPLIVFAVWIIFMNVSITSFAFLPILIMLWLIFDLKNIKQNSPLFLLIISAILTSLKVFWGVLIFAYGSFYVSFLIITILALICNKLNAKNVNMSVFGWYFILCSIMFSLPVLFYLNETKYSLQTNRGVFHLEKSFYESTDKLIKYIDTNTKTTDEIVIFPEGTFINFLTDRNTDNYYNSLIPLYYEVIGDEKLIEHFKKTKPEYIIFNNWNLSKDYSLGVICNDYAFAFCEFVAKNYLQEKIIDGQLRYLIFKRKQ